MKAKYVFDPVAMDEFDASILWYGERSLRAAEEFAKAVANKLEAICAAPTLYRIVYKHYREASLHKFPFSIVYSIDRSGKTLIVHSVYHHSRNPRKKYLKQ